MNVDEPETRDTVTAAADSRPAASASDLSSLDMAFIAFYRSFVPTLVAFLRFQGVPLTDAADIVQETMIEAYRGWATIEHPKAWARRVASRKWARHLATVVEDRFGEVPEPNPLLIITDVAAWEQRHEVLQILDMLPPRQRQVLAWTLDGYTPTQIAGELKIAPDAVRGSLAKARRAVAEHLRVTGDAQ